MPVTFVNKANKNAKPVEKSFEPGLSVEQKMEIEKKVARYVVLKEWADNEKPDPRYEELASLTTFLGEAADLLVDPEDHKIFEGENGESVKVKAKESRRSVVSAQKVFDELGPETARKIAKFNLTDLDKHLTKGQMNDLITTKFGTTRKIEILNKD